MKKNTKIAIGVGISIVGYLVFKANKVKQAVEQLQYKISNIEKLKFNFSSLSITGNISLRIINPTDTAIGVNTASLLELKKVTLFDGNTGNTIGSATVSISDISIPANSETVIEDIPVKVSILGGLLSNKLDNLKTEITLAAFGKDYIFNERATLG